MSWFGAFWWEIEGVLALLIWEAFASFVPFFSPICCLCNDGYGSVLWNLDLFMEFFFFLGIILICGFWCFVPFLPICCLCYDVDSFMWWSSICLWGVFWVETRESWFGVFGGISAKNIVCMIYFRISVMLSRDWTAEKERNWWKKGKNLDFRNHSWKTRKPANYKMHFF